MAQGSGNPGSGNAAYRLVEGVLRGRDSAVPAAQRKEMRERRENKEGAAVGGIQGVINDAIAAFEADFRRLPETGRPPSGAGRSKRRVPPGSRGGAGAGADDEGAGGELVREDDDLEARRKKGESDEAMAKMLSDPRIKFS